MARLLGLGDEPAAITMKIHQRPPPARYGVIHPHPSPVLCKLPRSCERAFPLRGREPGDWVLGEQVQFPLLPLSLLATMSAKAEWIGTARAPFSFFWGLKVKTPSRQSFALRSAIASSRAPVRAAIRMRSAMAGEAGPVRSLRTSSSVKGFSGIELDFIAAGAVRTRMSREMRFEIPGFDPFPQRDLGFDQFLLSRPALELVCRRRVEREPNIEFRPRSRVTELIASPDNRGVAGVRFEDTLGTPGSLTADLVVDASGRASPTLGFLEAIGSAKPPTIEIGIDQAYATTVFETPDDAPTDWLGVLHLPAPPVQQPVGNHRAHGRAAMERFALRKPRRNAAQRHRRVHGVRQVVTHADDLQCDPRRKACRRHRAFRYAVQRAARFRQARSASRAVWSRSGTRSAASPRSRARG